MPTLPTIEKTIRISARAASQLEHGSLWIFSNEIPEKITDIPRGTWCWFESDKRIVGTGYLNPHSLIAGRILSRHKETDISVLLRRKLVEAFKRRLPLFERGSFRLVFSEADFLPGIILDWYSGTMVLQSGTAGMDTVLDILEPMVQTVFKEVYGKETLGLVLRGDSSVRNLEGVPEFQRVSVGQEKMLRQGYFQEDDLVFRADFVEGQKTGFFLDQRDNRAHLETIIKAKKNARVLDLFCYSGGWGFHALRAGAAHVTFVDQSDEAVQFVKEGLERNEFPPEKATIKSADAFDYLESAQEEFDVVISDPPAFVKSKKVLPQAMKAYEKLNRLAWRRLRSGGILMTSSCSYHLSESDFLNVLNGAIQKEGGKAHIIYRGGQAADHPVLLSMPETRYLKCFGLQKI